jgi:hypothetical protein
VVFAAGVMMLASGAAPGIASRMRLLAGVVPLGVIEISHFLASIAGLLLLFVAWACGGGWMARTSPRSQSSRPESLSACSEDSMSSRRRSWR